MRPYILRVKYIDRASIPCDDGFAGSGILGVGETFEDAKTGYKVAVRSIADSNATVDVSFCLVNNATQNPCNFLRDGTPCDGTDSPVPMQCMNGRCELIAPNVKCGRYSKAQIVSFLKYTNCNNPSPLFKMAQAKS